MQYDLIIIGGGPAACAAAVYAARKRLKTLLIAEEIGGQSSVSNTIYNWIGTPEVGGGELAANLKKHIEYYTTPEHTLTLALGKRVTGIEKSGENFVVKYGETESVESKAVFVATGSAHRKLELPESRRPEQRAALPETLALLSGWVRRFGAEVPVYGLAHSFVLQ
jgi:alkyl hydroperoxide reductase subunit F